MPHDEPCACTPLFESLESRLLLSSFYISTSGSDSAAGTLAAPFASLGHVLAVAKPGDTAYIEGGTYNGSSSGWGDLSPTISGTASAPITIENYNGQKVTIDTGVAGSDTTFMYLQNSNKYLTFQGLNLANFKVGFKMQGTATAPSFINLNNINISHSGKYGTAQGDAWGIAMFNGTHDITINGCDIGYTAGPGILFQGDVSNLVIENTNSHDNNDGQGSSGDADGITGDVDGNYYPKNITLTNDRAWNNDEDGFDIKGVNVTETNLVAWHQVACDYKCWSPPNVQGSFTLTNVVGYDAGETVLRGRRAPIMTITDSSFRNTGTGESTFIYDYAGGQTWGGKLTMKNDSFYYNGTTSYAVAADIDKATTTMSMDNDRYYNSNNANGAFLMRNGSTSVTYGNAAFNNGSFYSAQGQEQHGQGVQQNIAPFLVTTNIPSTAAAGVATAFSTTAQDPEGNPLTYSWAFGDGTAPVSGASVTHAFANGGVYDVVLTVSDGTAQTVLDPLVTVTGGSSLLPPIANNDLATTIVNHAVTTASVLVNDSDRNGQALSVTAFTQAGHGTVVNNKNGTFTYTPTNNWTGADSFTYTISDTSGLTATASVNITVTPASPVANNDSATTAVNKAVTTTNVLANDTDPNGQTLSVSTFTQAAHGTVVNNNNGTFTYTPASNWTGADSFTYTVSDTSGLTAKATVNVTVNPAAPVANNDSATTAVSKAVTTTNVLANDTDPNGQTLSVSAFTQAGHGTVVNNNNGTFTYTPASNWTGADSFTYTVSDTSGLTATATVNVTVTPATTTSPVANNDSATTAVNKAVTTTNVLANDTDPNGQTLSVLAFTQAGHGTVVNNNNGTFTYTPASNWSGADNFTYTVSDTSGLTATATVNVTVTPATTSTPGHSYYIATTGSDSAAGTLATPFASLGHFLAVAKPGDTAYIEGGTYNGSSSGWGNLAPTVSGTAAAPITIENYNGQKVIIDTGVTGSNTTFVYLKHSNTYLTFQGLTLNNFKVGFNMQGSTTAPSYITLKNLNISHAGIYGTTKVDGAWGIVMFSGTHDVTIDGCDISFIAGPGILFQGNVSNILIENTNSHNNNDGLGSNGDADGFTGDVDGSLYPKNITLINDRAYNNSEDGFDIKGVNITETNLAAWGQVACDYKLWSPTNAQGSFTLNNVVGYNAGESVIRAFRAPNVTITNSSFLNAGTGESTFIYDSGQSWAGKLTLNNNKFYYNGTTSYAVAADIQKQNTTLNLNNDQYYNSNNVNKTFIMRNGSSAVTYGNAAFNNGSFYKAQGQELNGLGVQQNIAPLLVATSIPSVSTATTSTSFTATAVDANRSSLTYNWSFGDGTASVSGSSVMHKFAVKGVYNVTVTVSDGIKGTTLLRTVTVA